MSPPYTSQQLEQLDKDDTLSWTREEFEIPNARACGAEVDGDAVYFCGNSLGLLSKKGRRLMMEEMEVWSSRYVFLSISDISILFSIVVVSEYAAVFGEILTPITAQ